MLFVPWQFIADWRCSSCGICCRTYSVVLNFQEWFRIIKTYGIEQTASDLNRLFIRRKNDGSCAFLCDFANTNVCGLQHMKPKACKLWPFKVLGTPEYGYAKRAAYAYGEKTLFVYADSTCRGLRFGNPNWDFANCTVKEFAEIALGFRNYQFKTTANIGALSPRSQFFF